ncbi:MAG TPA: hypothetical protein VME70_04080 [Mycobacteriales bacterium]|nr:hypothetical protein [Mycobacteriales bacterium]
MILTLEAHKSRLCASNVKISEPGVRRSVAPWSVRRSIAAATSLALVGFGVVGAPAAAAGADRPGVADRTTAARLATARLAAATSGLGWVRAASAASAASAEAAHAPATLLAPRANSSEVQQIDHLLPAGHLGGRKQVAVLDIRDTAPGAAEGTVGITARAGSTGHAYWHATFTGSYVDGVDVLVEPLGAKGLDGVLVEQWTSTPDPVYTDDFDDDLQVTALSGKSGSVLWTQSFDGIYDTNTFSESGVAFNVQPFRDSHHKAIDFLVPLLTTLVSPEDQTQGELMSGVDGSVQSFAGSFAVDNSFPTETVVPDLNRDGFEDVVVDSEGSDVQALSGASPTGVQLWNTTISPDSTTEVSTIPDYSHPHVPDVVLASYAGPLHPRFEYTVLSGASMGHLLWQREADDMMTIGKVGSHKTPAVMLATMSTSSSASKYSETWHYSTISAANKVLYARHVTATIDNPGTAAYFTHATIGAIGDVNGDGTADVHVTIDNEPEYSLIAGSPAAKRVVHVKDGIISGRTGAFHSVVFDSPADGSLRKGKLVDLLQTHADKGKTRLVAFHGSTGKRYYSRLVHTLSGTASAWSAGARLTGHSCSDIALIAQTAPPVEEIAGGGWRNAASTPHGEAAVLSARGARLWTVTYAMKQATGGTLTVYKRPKHYCV